jgi:hypothetical protein
LLGRAVADTPVNGFDSAVMNDSPFGDEHMPERGSRNVHGKGAFIMKIATVELDLAKTLFQLHGFIEWIRRDISTYASNYAALMCKWLD